MGMGKHTLASTKEKWGEGMRAFRGGLWAVTRSSRLKSWPTCGGRGRRALLPGAGQGAHAGDDGETGGQRGVLRRRFFRGQHRRRYSGSSPRRPSGSDNEAATWAQDQCEEVPQQEQSQSPDPEQAAGRRWPPAGPGGPGRTQALYDCGMGGQ